MPLHAEIDTATETGRRERAVWAARELSDGDGVTTEARAYVLAHPANRDAVAALLLGALGL